MGMLIEGRWTEEDRIIERGAYVRQTSAYNQDLAPPLIAALATQPGRFHLIASHTCPWSHRAILVRRLKRLEDLVPLQIAGGRRLEGYPVDFGRAWAVPGDGRGIVHLHELYALSDPRYTGRVTVPVLWDSHRQRIVSNESSKIMRAFDGVRRGDDRPDFTLLPASLADRIEARNQDIYDNLNNGVYRAGFAENQESYDEAVRQVFSTLARLEHHLSTRRYLLGNVITEADWRLFPTLARFDIAYFFHHQCSLRRLIDYPGLWAYARDLYGWHGVAETVFPDAIHRSTYDNDAAAGRAGIIPVYPQADWREPHGREALGPAEVVLRSGRAIEIDPATLEPAPDQPELRLCR